MSSSSNPSAIAQRRRSSFANSNRATPKIQPLSREYFSSLIKLETDFHSNSYTVETLDDLVQLYARAVEYYDSIHDHISSYFTYKIQDILATKKSLKMLIQRKQTEKSEKADQKEESQKPAIASNPLKSVDTNRKDVIRESLGEDSSDEEGEKDRREQWEKKKENKKSSQSLASLKWQKQRFAQFYHKVETEKDSYQQDMHVVFSTYTSTSNENDSVIKRAISSQKQRVKQRIEQRKNNSFLSHTLNNTFNTNPGFNDENILKDLEDAPEVNNKDSMTPLLKKHIKNLIASKRESSKSNEQRDIATGKEEEGQVGEKLSTENSFTLNEANPNANETEILNSEALKLS